MGEDRVGLVLPDLQPWENKTDLADRVGHHPLGEGRVAIGAPRQDKRQVAILRGVHERRLRVGPAILLGGEIANHGRIGHTDAGCALFPRIEFRGRRIQGGNRAKSGDARKPIRRVVRPCWHRSTDGGEDVAVGQAEAKRPAAAHRDAAQVDAVPVDVVLLDNPLNRAEHPLLHVRRRILAMFVCVAVEGRVPSPPLVVGRVEIESPIIVRYMREDRGWVLHAIGFHPEMVVADVIIGRAVGRMEHDHHRRAVANHLGRHEVERVVILLVRAVLACRMKRPLIADRRGIAPGGQQPVLVVLDRPAVQRLRDRAGRVERRRPARRRLILGGRGTGGHEAKRGGHRQRNRTEIQKRSFHEEAV